MEWLKKLSDAICYIENNLDGEISYEEAAKIANCSTYYFKRMFSYVAGISLSDYIRRRRMTQAGFELQSTDARVLDTALKYGYTSPTSFNRAFQTVHGISPNAARSQGSLLQAYPPIRFSVQIAGDTPMPYRIEEKETMRIVGVCISLTEDMEENQRVVPCFWKKILQTEKFSEICNLSNKTPQEILGATIYQKSQGIYYYIGAATEKEVPAGMFEYNIPKATWVIFQMEGYFKESVQNIFKRFLTEWLPFSGYTYTELPNIEVYPINKKREKKGYMEVWIAIKKEKRKK